MIDFEQVYTALSSTRDDLDSVICQINSQFLQSRRRDDLCVYALALKTVLAELAQILSYLENDPEFRF